jgi:ABC-type transport system involved in cytochrome bd biosynthesis fused ATPase/permease subunit
MATTADRLFTVVKSDEILVMDSEQVVEFDHPCNLSKIKNGFFIELFKESWSRRGCIYLYTLNKKEYVMDIQVHS